MTRYFAYLWDPNTTDGGGMEGIVHIVACGYQRAVGPEAYGIMAAGNHIDNIRPGI